jgi:hypothetical protein
VRPPRRRPPPGRWLGLAAMVALLWFLGGRAGLVLGLVIAVIDLVRPLAPRRLLLGVLLLLLAVPLVLLARGLPTRATLSPEFISGSLVPHLLAGSALALLVLGVLRDVRASLPPPPETGPRALAPRPAAAAPELERGDSGRPDLPNGAGGPGRSAGPGGPGGPGGNGHDGSAPR